MLKEERHQRIIRALQESGSARVSDLAQKLQSSRATVWRDIDTLAKRGLVTKVHGGATLVHPSDGPALMERSLELVPPRPGLAIGFQVPESLYYFGPVISGARRACDRAGARLVVCVSDRGDLSDAVETLIDSDVDGMLLTPDFRTDTAVETSRWIAGLDRPVVLVERISPGLDLPGVRSVTSSREAGVYAALEHLQAQGHTRVGLVTLSNRGEAMRRVIAGWRLAARDLGLNTDNDEPREWIGNEPDEVVDGIRDAEVTGVLCMNDAFAAKVVRAFRRVGIVIPDQLSMISYDDEIAEHLKPPLTAVSPERETVGFVAVQQMLALLSNGDPGPARRISIDPKLVIRESTAPPPS